MLLGPVEEKVYCRYEGEHSQRHPAGSRLKQENVRGKGGQGRVKEERGGQVDQERSRSRTGQESRKHT